MDSESIIKEFISLVKKKDKSNFQKLHAHLLQMCKLEFNESECDSLVAAMLNYLNIAIDLTASKGHREQIKLCQKWLEPLQSVANNGSVRNTFIRRFTRRIFDILIEEDVKSWCVKKEILKMFVHCIQNAPKEVRHKVVTELPNIYLLKIMDSVSTYGDYDFQVILIETVFRMYGRTTIVSKLVDLLPESQELSESFAKIDGETFDEDVRKFLNILNKNSQKVFSVVCKTVFLGSMRCGEPMEDVNGLWVDFNRSEKAVSWYITTEARDGDAVNENELGWNLVTFFVTDVQTISIYRPPKCDDVMIYVKLKEPCLFSVEERSGAETADNVRFVVSYGSNRVKTFLSEVLPGMFRHKLQSNGPIPRASLAKKVVYKPLKISFCRRSRSNSSRSKSDGSSYGGILDPTSGLSDGKSSRDDASSVISISGSSVCSNESKRPSQKPETQYETAQMCRLEPSDDALKVSTSRCSARKSRDSSALSESAPNFQSCVQPRDSQCSLVTSTPKKKSPEQDSSDRYDTALDVAQSLYCEPSSNALDWVSLEDVLADDEGVNLDDPKRSASKTWKPREKRDQSSNAGKGVLKEIQIENVPERDKTVPATDWLGKFVGGENLDSSKNSAMFDTENVTPNDVFTHARVQTECPIGSKENSGPNPNDEPNPNRKVLPAGGKKFPEAKEKQIKTVDVAATPSATKKSVSKDDAPTNNKKASKKSVKTTRKRKKTIDESCWVFETLKMPIRVPKQPIEQIMETKEKRTETVLAETMEKRNKIVGPTLYEESVNLNDSWAPLFNESTLEDDNGTSRNERIDTKTDEGILKVSSQVLPTLTDIKRKQNNGVVKDQMSSRDVPSVTKKSTPKEKGKRNKSIDIPTNNKEASKRYEDIEDILDISSQEGMRTEATEKYIKTDRTKFTKFLNDTDSNEEVVKVSSRQVRRRSKFLPKLKKPTTVEIIMSDDEINIEKPSVHKEDVVTIEITSSQETVKIPSLEVYAATRKMNEPVLTDDDLDKTIELQANDGIIEIESSQEFPVVPTQQKLAATNEQVPMESATAIESKQKPKNDITVEQSGEEDPSLAIEQATKGLAPNEDVLVDNEITDQVNEKPRDPKLVDKVQIILNQLIVPAAEEQTQSVGDEEEPREDIVTEGIDSFVEKRELVVQLEVMPATTQPPGGDEMLVNPTEDEDSNCSNDVMQKKRRWIRKLSSTPGGDHDQAEKNSETFDEHPESRKSSREDVLVDDGAIEKTDQQILPPTNELPQKNETNNSIHHEIHPETGDEEKPCEDAKQLESEERSESLSDRSEVIQKKKKRARILSSRSSEDSDQKGEQLPEKIDYEGGFDLLNQNPTRNRKKRKICEDINDLTHLKNTTEAETANEASKMQREISLAFQKDEFCKKKRTRDTKKKNKADKSIRLKVVHSSPKKIGKHNNNFSATFCSILDSFRKKVNVNISGGVEGVTKRTRSDKVTKRTRKTNKNATKTFNSHKKYERMRDLSVSNISENSLKLAEGGNIPNEGNTSLEVSPVKKINIISDVQLQPSKKTEINESSIADVNRNYSLMEEHISNNEICNWIETGSPNYTTKMTERKIVLRCIHSILEKNLEEPDETEVYKDVLSIYKISKKYV